MRNRNKEREIEAVKVRQIKVQIDIETCKTESEIWGSRQMEIVVDREEVTEKLIDLVRHM